MIDDPVPTGALSPAAARDLTDRLQATVALALDLVEQAYLGKAWKALGYPSWAEFCATEFTGLHRTRLSREERRDAALGWAAAGMSTRATRAIGHALGVDHHTAAADLATGQSGEDSHPPPPARRTCSGSGRRSPPSRPRRSWRRWPTPWGSPWEAWPSWRWRPKLSGSLP